MYNLSFTNGDLIIIAVCIGLSGIYIYHENKNNKNDPTFKYNDDLLQKMNKLISHQQKINNQIEKLEDMNIDKERKQFLNNRDRQVIYNDLTAPERRVPEYQYPYNYVKEQINVPTRGYPENYQQIGVAMNEGKAFNLFGRQTYPGSNQYEYYVQGTMHGTNVKLPIATKGKKEIENNQEIHVPGNGHFKTEIFPLDAPRYIPF